MVETKKYQFYLNLVPITGTTEDFVITGLTEDSSVAVKFGIIGSDNVVRDFYDKDFYLNIPIFKTYKIEEYIDVKNDEQIFSLERQEFNPYYIELGFFDSIERNKVNHGSELNQAQIDYIKSVRTDLPSNNFDIPTWYENFGKSELPWFKATNKEVTLNMIDITGQTNTSIISKAYKFPIDINT